MKTFCFLLIFSCLISCKSESNTGNETLKSSALSSSACISEVLKYDEEVGKIRNHACESKSLSSTITEYVGAFKDISFDSCSDEFRQAFHNHLAAWEESMIITDKYSDLRGEMHDLFEIIETSSDSAVFKALVKNIWDTWSDVEKAGGK